MDALARQNEMWTVITHDLGDPAHPHRVSELVARKLSVFVLHSSWSRHDFWKQAYRLTQWWPTIQRDATSNAPGTIHDVPYRFTEGRSLRRR